MTLPKSCSDVPRGTTSTNRERLFHVKPLQIHTVDGLPKVTEPAPPMQCAHGSGLQKSRLLPTLGQHGGQFWGHFSARLSGRRLAQPANRTRRTQIRPFARE